jgi:hypothetical protein
MHDTLVRPSRVNLATKPEFANQFWRARFRGNTNIVSTTLLHGIFSPSRRCACCLSRNGWGCADGFNARDPPCKVPRLMMELPWLCVSSMGNVHHILRSIGMDWLLWSATGRLSQLSQIGIFRDDEIDPSVWRYALSCGGEARSSLYLQSSIRVLLTSFFI